jgi:cell division protein FtsN
MVRTNQGGSILNFVIIGVILALLLVGGAYFVRQRSQLTADNGTSAPAPANPATPEEESAPENDTPAPSTPAEEKDEQASREEAAPLTPAQPQTDEAKELPETGPAETISAIFALGLVSYMTTAYVRSRRARNATLTSLL